MVMLPAGVSLTGDADPDGVLRQGVRHVLAPLHGADTAPGEIILPADVEQVIGAVQTVHIKVEQRQPTALVLIHNGKGGAGDPALVAKPRGKSPGEGSLAHTQIPQICHHRAGVQHGGQTGADGFRLCLVMAVKFHGHPPLLHVIHHIIARPTENVKTKFNKFTGPFLCGILSACRKSFFAPLSKFPELYKSSENLGF